MNLKNQKLACLGLVLALVACAGCASRAKEPSAQAAPAPLQSAGAQPPSGAAVAAEEAEVKKSLDKFFHSVDVRDWKAVDEVIAKDFEYYGDGTTVLSRDEFIKAMKDDDMKIDKLELKNVKVSLSSDGQMAWVKYGAYMESSMRGAPYNMESVETVAFRKEDGQWKMTHNHASVKKLDAKPAKA